MGLSDRYYVGIDLGTVNTCLAYANGEGTVAVSNNEGSGLLPSAILFTDGKKIVGNAAYEMSQDYGIPDSVFYFKRIMGERFRRYIGDVSYNPAELSAIVLTKVLQNYKLNTGQAVSEAVITVPSDFNEAERRATVDAATIAGIGHVELLNESIAAAIAYRRFSDEVGDRNIIVYDLGGGTLDITVMNIHDGEFTVLSNESSKDLGGRDWDLQLAAIIQRKVLGSCGLMLDDVGSDVDFRRSVMIEAEKQKKVLATSMRSFGYVRLGGEPVRFTVTRDEFEESTYRLMMKTIDMVGHALRNADMKMSQIDSILLVGGATLIPQVKRSLEDAFPSAELVSFDPQHAVARGAALYARSIFQMKDISVSSVSSRTLGILAGIDGVEKICNVVFRNNKLPIERELMCRPKRDDQSILEISLYESLAKEGDDFIDQSEGKLLSKVNINLPEKVSRGRTKIPVRFSIDVNGRISITAECNGESMDCIAHGFTSMTDDELEEAKSKMGDIE